MPPSVKSVDSVYTFHTFHTNSHIPETNIRGTDGLPFTFKETNLKRFRSAYGCSQSELAKLSGVSLRSIQIV